LIEPVVPQTDSREWLRALHADSLVSDSFQSMARFGSTNRDRNQDAGGLVLPQGRDRSFHRRSGGEAVVNDDHRAVSQHGTGTITAIKPIAPLEFQALACGYLIDDGVGDGKLSKQLLAEDTHAAGSDGPHRQLGVTWHAELTDQKYIERDTQRASDLDPDSHAAAGEAENDDVIPCGISGQPGGELATRVSPITESHWVGVPAARS
jgi:hypothetical protein